mmetsp:Transcript_41562/g.54724  ORF Transcript_41562/g.54724 Transcript_41562/m.54724 type:complete len:133 (+) Transcript_41562:62-460(+)
MFSLVLGFVGRDLKFLVDLLDLEAIVFLDTLDFHKRSNFFIVGHYGGALRHEPGAAVLPIFSVGFAFLDVKDPCVVQLPSLRLHAASDQNLIFVVCFGDRAQSKCETLGGLEVDALPLPQGLVFYAKIQHFS